MARTWRVLVSDQLSEEGLAALRGDNQVEVVVKTGLAPEELKQEIAEAHALLVRSATKVTAEVIAAGAKLMVIGRAGVGVDNIDVPAATRRGIVVCNSPEGNTVAAAEHTWALILALARSIPAASASVAAGEWKRSAFMGVELFNKTLGVIGLGKIGREVALRAAAFGMRVVADDPFVSADQAARLGTEIVALPELLARSDFITIHVPLNRDTRHLLDAAGSGQARGAHYQLRARRHCGRGRPGAGHRGGASGRGGPGCVREGAAGR
jgi:D-3-phosphoglycerate dehydrogenase